MANPVRTVKRKYDGSEKPAWDGDLVEATDEWLAVFYEWPPPWKGMPGETRFAIRYFGTAAPLSVLVAFDERGAVLQYQCDAGLPATLEGRTVAFVDLELDVIAAPDLSYFLRDEEDFEANRERWGYPEDVVAAAWEGIALAERMLKSQTYPFDGSAERLLGISLASAGPL